MTFEKVRSTILVIIFLGAPVASANVVGNGLQNFNSITSGLDFVSVHSSETLKPGIFNIGIFMNEAVNSLPYMEGGSQGRTTFNDTILGLDLNLGVGLLTNWDVGISLPFVLNQTVGSDQAFHGEYRNKGNTEVRISSKYRLFGDDSGGFAVVGTINFDRTGGNPYTGSPAGPIYNLELVLDTTIREWALGLNLGYRKTNPGDSIAGAFMEPMGNQIIGSAAASYLLPSLDTKLIFEVFGSIPAEKKASNPDRTASSLEFLAGVKHDLTHNLAIHGGAGTELQHGVSSPDWRAYAGLNYTFGPQSKDSLQPKAIGPGRDRIVTHNIQFEFDSSLMIGDYDVILGEVAKRFREGGYKKIIIVGYTDSIGRVDYNDGLSLQRSQIISTYLSDKKNISRDLIEAEGRGERDAIADNGNFQGRQENRRVEFILLK
jgi:outer membrane protein OmpA-like peptidoglycan-associated protein